MLAKINRLNKKKDFEIIFKEGQGYKEDFLYLKIKKNKLGSSRFAVVAGKDFSKKANKRNKIKRQIREILKTKLQGVGQNVDGVIIVLPKAESDFQELKNTIDKLFKKAKII